MTSLPARTIGVTLPVRADGSHLADAAELERLGYAALWLNGGQLDELARLSEIVAATTSVLVGTAVVPTGLFDAPALAALALDTDRLVLGLGGVQQPRSMALLRRYLDDLDAAGVPAADRLLAALGPRKVALAAERTGGAIVLLVTADFTASVRQSLGADRTLVVDLIVVLDTDPQRARATARQTLGFLASVPGYRASFVRMGFTEHDIDELCDELVDALVAWGDADEIARRVDEHFAAGADHVVVSPHGDDPVGDARVLAGRLLARR